MSRNTRIRFSFLAILLSTGLLGCNDAVPMPMGPTSPHYLLNGQLSDQTDANGFDYYTEGDEAYVARGSNASTAPSIPEEVTLSGKTYTVTGIYHSGFSKAPITSITLPPTIETIDYQAFANSALTSVAIPHSVEAMGSGAFMNCHSLTAVQFKNKENSNPSSTEVCSPSAQNRIFREGGAPQTDSKLTAIPDYCFFNDEHLSTIAFPYSLRVVETCAFSNCVGLKKLAFLTGFTTLEKYALESCTSLTDLYFPLSFTGFTNESSVVDTSNCEPGAFYNVNPNCTIHLSATNDNHAIWKAATSWRDNGTGSLNVEDLPEAQDVAIGSDYLYRREEGGEATIFSYAPSVFPNDGVVVMPNVIDDCDVTGVAETTYQSFKTQITQIYLSNKLKSIPSNIFAGMNALTAISTNGDTCYQETENAIDLSGMTQLTEVGDYLFSVGIADDANTKDKQMAALMETSFSGELKLPASLQTIGEGAFSGLKKAAKISIAEGSLLETIGKKAFLGFGWSRQQNNYGDEFGANTFDLVLPTSCSSIGERAFSRVCGLKNIQFLNKSLTINNYAFLMCRSLCNISFPMDATNLIIGQEAFRACSSGGGRSFLKIPGIEEVFFPATLSSLGKSAFANNERACFFFAGNKLNAFNNSYNEVFTENTSGDYCLNSLKTNNYYGLRENTGEYFNVGFDGKNSQKRRFLQTDDFDFIEAGTTETLKGKFICARYRFNPETAFTGNAKTVEVTVPKYIKFKDGGAHPYDGQNGTGAETDFEVISIGDSCFSGCYVRNGKGLGVVNVPDSIKRIGDNAFLRSIFFHQLNSYGREGDNSSYDFPSGLKYIGRSAFACTRLEKAELIPGDVVTFDMLDPEALGQGLMPYPVGDLDGSVARTYAGTTADPRRYSSIFANDWFLSKVTFNGSPVTMAFDAYEEDEDKPYGALYRKKKVSANNVQSDEIQLLMVTGRLTNDFSLTDNTGNEADYLDYQEGFEIGGNEHPFLTNTKSLRYGSLRMAGWAETISLDQEIDELFPMQWGSNPAMPIPQALLSAEVKLATYLNIGNLNDDKHSYAIKTKVFNFTDSNTETTETLALPDGVLRNATEIDSMTFPKTLTEIPDFAFDRAAKISSWVTPKDNSENPELVVGGSHQGEIGTLDLSFNTNLTRIGTSSFWGSKGIVKLYLPSSLQSLGSWTLPANDKRSTFEEATDAAASDDVMEVVIMENCTQLTALPTRCFQGHRKLHTVTLPSNLTSVGEKCFNYCSIQDLVLPDTVETIANLAFGNNKAFVDNPGMQSVCLSANLKTLNSGAFSSCDQLKRVYVKDPRASSRPNGKYGEFNLGDNTFKYAEFAMLPWFIGTEGMPFKDSSSLKALFYGGKYSEYVKSKKTTRFAKYSGGSKDAPVGFYAEINEEIDVDAITNKLFYWRLKPGETDIIAEVVEKNGSDDATPVKPISPAKWYNFTTGANSGNWS